MHAHAHMHALHTQALEASTSRLIAQGPSGCPEESVPLDPQMRALTEGLKTVPEPEPRTPLDFMAGSSWDVRSNQAELDPSSNTGSQSHQGHRERKPQLEWNAGFPCRGGVAGWLLFVLPAFLLVFLTHLDGLRLFSDRGRPPAF